MHIDDEEEEDLQKLEACFHILVTLEKHDDLVDSHDPSHFQDSEEGVKLVLWAQNNFN